MLAIIDFIEKISSSSKHILITIIGILATLYYIHTEFKSNFDTLYKDLDQRLTIMSNKFETFTHTAELKQTFILEDIRNLREKYSKLNENKINIKDYKAIEEKLIHLEQELNKVIEKIFFLDRFIARIETHMLYSKNNYKLTNTTARTESMLPNK